MAISRSNVRHRTEVPAERERMVRAQLVGRGITDKRVLDAMRRLPRDAFVQGMQEFAYEDSPLPIAEGQTISQPYIVAAMTQAAEIKPGDRVLDVGTGSGYAAAVLAEMADEVYSIERHKALADNASARFQRLGYRNIHVRHGDGTLGWPAAAPFDAIIVAAGGPEIPEALRGQLKLGGRMIIPLGDVVHHQRLVKIVRKGENDFSEQELEAVRFVPLIGEQGWAENSVKQRSREEFFERVGEGLKSIRPVNVQDAVRVVFQVLNHHIEPGQVQKVREALPETVRELWPDQAGKGKAQSAA